MAFKFVPKDPALAAFTKPAPAPAKAKAPKVKVPPAAPPTPPQPAPPAERKKVPVTIRLDADLVAALKATGPGWQTTVNSVLRDRILR